MCLYNDKIQIRRILARKSDVFTCYKIIKVKVCPPNTIKIKAPYREYYYKPGYNHSTAIASHITGKVSRRKQIDSTRLLTYINQGIHIYRHRKDAEMRLKNLNLYGVYYYIVEVICFKKDLLGANNKEMAFTKVFLSKSEYEKALKLRS